MDDAPTPNEYLRVLPELRTRAEWTKRLTHLPPDVPKFDELEGMSIQDRTRALYSLGELYQPYSTPLAISEQVEISLHESLRRRPQEARPVDFWDTLVAVREPTYVFADRSPATSSLSLSVIGPSGVGKTMTIQRILDQFPQVIMHPRETLGDRERRQVVWLHVDCSATASLKGFLGNVVNAFDIALNEDYLAKRVKKSDDVEKVRRLVTELLLRHRVGILVIDEVQMLQGSGVNPHHVLNALTTLSNTSRTPIVYVGTYKALDVLGSEMYQARRATNMGEFYMHRVEYGAEWNIIVRSLLNYQYTLKPITFSEEFSRALHDASAGILDTAVRLIMLAQVRAMRAAKDSPHWEKLSPELIGVVAKPFVKMIQVFLAKLRKFEAGDMRAWRNYEELRPVDWAAVFSNALSDAAVGAGANSVSVPDGDQRGILSVVKKGAVSAESDEILSLLEQAEKDGTSIASAVEGSPMCMDPLDLLDEDSLDALAS